MKKRLFAGMLTVLMLLPVLSISAFAASLPKGFKPIDEVFTPYKVDGNVQLFYESWNNIKGKYFEGCRVIGDDMLANAWINEFSYAAGKVPATYDIQSEPFAVYIADSGPISGESGGKVTSSFTIKGTSTSSVTVTTPNSFRSVGDSMSVKTFFDLKVDILELGNYMRFAWYAVSGTMGYSYTKNTKLDGSVSDTVTFTLDGYPNYGACSLAADEGDSRPYLKISAASGGSSDGSMTFGIYLTGAMPGSGGAVGSLFDDITQDADTGSGEDGGVSVLTVIVVGLAGAGAAVAAGAAASGAAASGATAPDADAESADDERRKRYKMYIQKDFGDAIRKGAEPVKVRARIAEVDEDGTQRDRDDLTARIQSASGDGMEILDAVTAGRYCEVTVRIPADYEGETADLTFTFAGEGGSFRNTVRFRAVGSPRIEFAEGDGSALSYNGQVCRISMIEGDGLTYSLRFTVKDAATEPNVADMRGENNGFSATFEKADAPYTYIARIRNGTTKQERGIFYTRSELYTHIYVTCEGEKEPIEGAVYVTAVPEGLSVICRETENGFMTVDTNKDSRAAGLDPEIRPVSFETVLAYTVDEADGKHAYIAEPNEYEVSFGELSGAKDYIESFRLSFRYEIDERMADDKRFAFAPKVVLPQPNAPYEVELPITAIHKGNRYSVKLPLMLCGEQPKKPTERDTEKELLQRALVRYGLGNNAHLRQLLRNAESLTATELFMLRRAIILEATEYYTNEAKEFNDLDQSLGRYEFTFSCIRWISDQAFSLMAAYIYSPTAEAFITPFKDLVGQFLGELTASAYWGGDVKTSWSSIGQATLKGCENHAANKMCDAVIGRQPKQLGAVIATFLFITFLEKFYFDEDAAGDIYKSLTATFNDLAGNAIKTVITAKLGDIMKESPRLKELRDSVRDYYAKDFCERFPDATIGIGKSINFATDRAMKMINATIEKYVVETLRLTATVYIANLEELHSKLNDVADSNALRLHVVEEDMTAGRITENEALHRAVGITRRAMSEYTDRSLFDFDIQIGDSVLRINILDNLEGIVNFIWGNTFATLLPENGVKEIPPAECPPYFKIMP